MRGLGINAKTQYAVQTVIFLAQQERTEVVPVSAIAAVVSISPKFLEDILAALRAAGIVQSRRGKEGGYQLVPAAGELTVLDVVQAMEGPVMPAAPGSGSGMARAAAATFERALEGAAQLLEQTTVEDLVQQARRLDAEPASGYMYYL